MCETQGAEFSDTNKTWPALDLGLCLPSPSSSVRSPPSHLRFDLIPVGSFHPRVWTFSVIHLPTAPSPGHQPQRSGIHSTVRLLFSPASILNSQASSLLPLTTSKHLRSIKVSKKFRCLKNTSISQLFHFPIILSLSPASSFPSTREIPELPVSL